MHGIGINHCFRQPVRSTELLFALAALIHKFPNQAAVVYLCFFAEQSVLCIYLKIPFRFNLIRYHLRGRCEICYKQVNESDRKTTEPFNKCAFHVFFPLRFEISG